MPTLSRTRTNSSNTSRGLSTSATVRTILRLRHVHAPTRSQLPLCPSATQMRPSRPIASAGSAIPTVRMRASMTSPLMRGSSSTSA